MRRAPRAVVEDGILDEAAALFARHGFEQTSVQAVADAVGLSKAGLLHHYPSKEILRQAVSARSEELTRRATAELSAVAPGVGRDRRTIEVMVDLALSQPGTVALMLGDAAAGDTSTLDVAAHSGQALAWFGEDMDTERRVRVTGAMASLAVLALAAHQAGEPDAWRPHIVNTSYDALGHAPSTPSDTQEL